MIHEGSSESNASYFIILAHNVEADVGGLTLEAESSCQYSIMFCYLVTDDSRRAIWQNGVWHRSLYEAKMCHWIPPCGKDGTHWHLSIFAECLWSPNSGCEHSEAAGATFQQWQQQVTSTDADFYKCSMHALVQSWCIANGADYVKKQCFVAKNVLYQIVLLCSLYLL